MSEWKEVRLGDVATFINGRAYLQPELQDKGKYKIVRVGNLSGGDKWFYSDMELEEEKYCNKGDLLYAWACTFGPYIWKSGKTIYHYHIWKINEKAECVDKLFLYYLLIFQTPLMLGNVNGSVMLHITKSSIEKTKVRIPSSINTQQRIVSILSSLDAKIENNNKINAKLEEIAQNLFKEWFVDFGPFKDGKFVESELGMIPEGWRVGTLGEIAEINPSRSIKKDSYSTYLDMKNMPTTGPFPIQWESKTYSGGMKFKNGDTLMARITPCLENGKVAYVNFLNDEEIGFGSTEYIVISPKDEYFPEFFYFLCRDKRFIDYAVANMNGSSGRQRVSGNAICNYSMPIPPQGTINKLTSIKSLMEKIKYNCLENQRLATLRDTLLPKLISGEIKL